MPSARRLRRARRRVRYRRHRRPLLWWAAAAVAGVAGAVLLFPFALKAFQWCVEALGWGLFPVLLLVTFDLLLLIRRPSLRGAGWRWWLSLHMLVVLGLGLLGLFAPRWRVGGVDFGKVSLGGRAGDYLSGSPMGLTALGLLGLAAGLLGWPSGAGRVVTFVFGSWRWAWRRRLWLWAWRGIRGLLASLGSLTPAGEREEAGSYERQTPFIAQWDEEWPSPVLKDEEAPSVEREAVSASKGGWELPPMSLLTMAAEEGKPLDNEARARLIVETLRSFGVDAKVVSIQQGPTVTQFGIEPGWEVKTRKVPERDERGRIVGYRTEVVSKTRVRVNRITALANDLALALAAPTIRIEAPVPGRPIIGIEVPNSSPSVVTLRSVMESPAFQKVGARSRLAIALGKGVSGEPIAADLARMPHLLIAGTTGSGKSVCINSIITCLLMRNTPDDVRFVLIDPKRVELAPFAPIPHLVFSRVVVEIDEVPAVLAAVVREMESRYKLFASVGVRNIEAYNQSPRISQKIPYWVVIIDELADLMVSAPYQVEKSLVRLAQLARATGIHLIVATQRPSVDVVTGLIKANFPARIAFAVSSQVDSRTILDMAGAEKLLGKGDMLYLPTEASQPRRIQGCYLSDAEIERVVKWWSDDRFRHLRPPPLDQLIQETTLEEAPQDDPLLDAARELAMLHRRISPATLQRRLNIGRERAVRLIRLMEEEGLVAYSDDPLASRRVLAHHGDPS